jgi:hypothetical protein
MCGKLTTKKMKEKGQFGARFNAQRGQRNTLSGCFSRYMPGQTGAENHPGFGN